MYFVEVFGFYIPRLLPVSGDGGVEGYSIHPRGDLGLASERRERFPKLKHDLLKKIIADIAVVLVHETHFVDQSLMFVNQVNEFFLVPSHQWRFVDGLVEDKERKLQDSRRSTVDGPQQCGPQSTDHCRYGVDCGRQFNEMGGPCNHVH